MVRHSLESLHLAGQQGDLKLLQIVSNIYGMNPKKVKDHVRRGELISQCPERSRS